MDGSYSNVARGSECFRQWQVSLHPNHETEFPDSYRSFSVSLKINNKNSIYRFLKKRKQLCFQ